MLIDIQVSAYLSVIKLSISAWARVFQRLFAKECNYETLAVSVYRLFCMFRADQNEPIISDAKCDVDSIESTSDSYLCYRTVTWK